MNKKELMKKAHKMTRKIKAENPTVDYKFQLGLCLSYLHEEVKRIEKMLNNLGCKTWIKGDCRRVYVNDLGVIAKKLGYDFSNAKLFARTKFYFDCTVCEFFFTATSSVKKHVLDVIELIKK